MSRAMVESLVRDSLRIIGTLLAAFGVVDEQTMQAFAGASLTLFGVVWGLVDKRGR